MPYDFLLLIDATMSPYTMLSRLFPTRPAPENPQRVVLIRPCCIGDVMQATAALKALRRGYPQAHITFAVGGWSKRAIEQHDAVDAVLDTGPAANPASSIGGMRRLVSQLRGGNFDMAVSLMRSPLMSAAVLLSGIPCRVGLDSLGRGFGYTVRVPVDPAIARHEAEIYLDVMRALDIDTRGCTVNVPVRDDDRASVQARLGQVGISAPYLVVNPAGGGNPGMEMASKRWPPEHFAALVEQLSAQLNRQVVFVAGPDDGAIIDAVQHHLSQPLPAFLGDLSFGEIAALAKLSSGYIGNDTGLTHLAAATGTKTIMILGPSDPVRYAPFAPNALGLWKPSTLVEGGVASGVPKGWTWAKDGISVNDAIEKIGAFL